MADINRNYEGTVVVDSPVTLDVIDGSASPGSVYYDLNMYQFDMTGAGALEIETKTRGQSAFNSQGTFSGETVNLDMIGLAQIKLTASGSNVPTTIKAIKS